MLSCACKIILMQESERVVSKKEGIDFAREYGCLFLECSAKTRVNVEQCFEELVLKVHIVEALFVFFFQNFPPPALILEKSYSVGC